MSDARAESYRGKALERIVADLAMEAGARNEALNRASFELGRLAGLGLTEGEGRQAVHNACSSNGLLERHPGPPSAHVFGCEVCGTFRSGWQAGARAPRSLPASSTVAHASQGVAVTMPAPVDPEPGYVRRAPSYPPQEAIAGLWEGATRRLIPDDVVAYLRGRGFSDTRARRIFDGHLAAVLPADYPTADYMRHAPDGSLTTWHATGHRLLVPLYDHEGQLRSVLARCIGDSSRKSTTPARYQRRGLVMANDLARLVLGSGRPQWMGRHPLELVITEGEMDFLAWSVAYSEADEYAPAVIAVFSGGWTQEMADRIPEGTTVRLATDDDDAGRKYRDKIEDTLTGHGHRLERVGYE